MMSHDESLLWQRIRDFGIDSQDTVFTFADRLAQENNWPKEYALSVISEYKKFLFLSMVSDRCCSPSSDIDQAWHLHLTYTRSYWIDMCKNMLGRDLHHNPTKGGEAEDYKHQQLFAHTRQLYKLKFNEEPPDRIWSNDPKKPLDDSPIEKALIIDVKGRRFRKIIVGVLLLGFACLVYNNFLSQASTVITIAVTASLFAFVSSWLRGGKGGDSDSGGSCSTGDSCSSDHHSGGHCSSGSHCSGSHGCSSHGCSSCGSSCSSCGGGD